jgi:hypothetical protein
VVIIGGMGSLGGAAIGALIVGLADNFGKALFPKFPISPSTRRMALILAVKRPVCSAGNEREHDKQSRENPDGCRSAGRGCRRRSRTPTRS